LLRNNTLITLELYKETWGRRDASELAAISTIKEFTESSSDCYLRSHLVGHLTGSALISTPKLDRVLLTLHKKLGKWLQTGGHADGNPILDQVATKEAHEESGLKSLSPLKYEHIFGHDTPHPLPFDIDFHQIPARPKTPEHIHYDVRYLLITENPDEIVISEESNDLRWFDIDEAFRVTNEKSMHRQFDKVLFLKNKL